MNYRMRLYYSEMINVDVGEWNGERCVIIPIEKNNIYIREKKICQSFEIVEKPTYEYNNSHFVRETWTKKHWERMNELGFYQTPIVGNMQIQIPKFKFDAAKPFSSQQSSVKEINNSIDNALNK